MRSESRQKLVKRLFWAAIFGGAMLSSGCASPGRMASGLVAVPFEVAKYTAGQSAQIGIGAAEVGARTAVAAVIR